MQLVYGPSNRSSNNGTDLYTYSKLLIFAVRGVQSFAYALSMERTRLEKAPGDFDIDIPRRTQRCKAHPNRQRGRTMVQPLLTTLVSILHESVTVLIVA